MLIIFILKTKEDIYNLKKKKKFHAEFNDK